MSREQLVTLFLWRRLYEVMLVVAPLRSNVGGGAFMKLCW